MCGVKVFDEGLRFRDYILRIGVQGFGGRD